MLRKKLFAEFLGTGTLVATVVGSGIMATDISADIGIQLLINTIATVFVLYILITLLAPISGAHFNPLVSVISYLRKELSLVNTFWFLVMQVLGGSFGAILANLMFEHPALDPSQKVRDGAHLWLGKSLPQPALSSLSS